MKRGLTWLEKYCDCQIVNDAEPWERPPHPRIEKCGLHEFAEAAARWMNQMLAANQLTVEQHEQVEKLLDNWGVLDDHNSGG